MPCQEGWWHTWGGTNHQLSRINSRLWASAPASISASASEELRGGISIVWSSCKGEGGLYAKVMMPTKAEAFLPTPTGNSLMPDPSLILAASNCSSGASTNTRHRNQRSLIQQRWQRAGRELWMVTILNCGLLGQDSVGPSEKWDYAADLGKCESSGLVFPLLTTP